MDHFWVCLYAYTEGNLKKKTSTKTRLSFYCRNALQPLQKSITELVANGIECNNCGPYVWILWHFARYFGLNNDRG